MIADYDVKLPLMARSNRTSFVVGRNGRIAYVLSEMKPDGHITGTLAAVRQTDPAKKGSDPRGPFERSTVDLANPVREITRCGRSQQQGATRITGRQQLDVLHDCPQASGR